MRLTLPPVRRWLPARVARFAVLRLGLLHRAMTLGVRIAVVDAAGRVLLVRHTYVPGWHLPGGAVDPGESALAAAMRELQEETGVRATARPTLFGLYRNAAGAGRDHVALYVLREHFEAGAAVRNSEIADTGWFKRDALPAETTRATLARLAEVFDGNPSSETW